MINIVKRGDFKDKVVLIVHGIGEHIGRYERFIDRLVDEGLSVVGFDLPGHGKSSGIRGHAPIRKILRIIDSIVEDVGEPIIFGHSLGGLVAARYVERGGKAKALVISSPGFAYSSENVSPFLIGLAKFLSFIVPFLPMDNRLPVEALSRNPDAVRRYVEDPLVHRKVSVALARDFFVESVKAVEEAKKIGVPTLVLVGTADRITPPEGAKGFYERLECEKKFIEYEGGYHELFEDPEHADRFVEDIISFMKDLEV